MLIDKAWSQEVTVKESLGIMNLCLVSSATRNRISMNRLKLRAPKLNYLRQEKQTCLREARS